MMNASDSNMAANAICNAVEMASESMQQAAGCYTAPSILFRPKLSRDGNQWCALYGDDLQSGVAGFGDSPQAAMQNFDREWYRPIEQKGGAA